MSSPNSPISVDTDDLYQDAQLDEYSEEDDSEESDSLEMPLAPVPSLYARQEPIPPPLGMGDPYDPRSHNILPPPPPAASPSRPRWQWIRRILGLWRREEGDFIPPVEPNPNPSQVCPITNETTRLTIHLLIARLLRHEDQIHELQNARQTQTDPDFQNWVRSQLYSMRTEINVLRQRQDYLEGLMANRMTGIESRLEDLLRLLVGNDGLQADNARTGNANQ